MCTMPKSKEKKAESKSKPKAKAAAKKPAKKKAAKPVITLTHDAVAKRAYELWVSQGCPQGRAEQHWAEAEKQLVEA